MRYENYQTSHMNVLKVRQVYLDGPACRCDIESLKDYIVAGKEHEHFGINTNYEIQIFESLP